MCVKIECLVTATQLRGTLWNPAASQDLSEMYKKIVLCRPEELLVIHSNSVRGARKGQHV